MLNYQKVLAVVPVTEVETAAGWYERLLGRPADARPMAGLADWHVSDDAWVSVFVDPARAGSTLLNLAVDDLEAHAAELAGRGIVLGERTVTAKGAKFASATDPDGNRVTILENPST